MNANQRCPGKSQSRRRSTLGEWKIRLTTEPELNLKIGAENEYETDAAREDKQNDLKYWLSLGLDF